MAQGAGVLCHVDACLGGWLLPFWERLGESVPPWDLRVDGVTSLSADVHKYGYSTKGASTVLYAAKDLYRHQFFLYDDWPGGLYGSSTSAGTRGGVPIAEAWTAVRHLGAEGYLRLAGGRAGHHPEDPGRDRRHRRPARSPAIPTSRCSSSAPRPSTSSAWATPWTTAAGTSTASRAACTSCSPRATPGSPTSSWPTWPTSVADHEASRGREATYGGTV